MTFVKEPKSQGQMESLSHRKFNLKPEVTPDTLTVMSKHSLSAGRPEMKWNEISWIVSYMLHAKRFWKIHSNLSLHAENNAYIEANSRRTWKKKGVGRVKVTFTSCVFGTLE